jgi:hypothetical protein
LTLSVAQPADGTHGRVGSLGFDGVSDNLLDNPELREGIDSLQLLEVSRQDREHALLIEQRPAYCVDLAGDPTIEVSFKQCR